jgi:hypothetical protein
LSTTVLQQVLVLLPPYSKDQLLQARSCLLCANVSGHGFKYDHLNDDERLYSYDREVTLPRAAVGIDMRHYVVLSKNYTLLCQPYTLVIRTNLPRFWCWSYVCTKWTSKTTLWVLRDTRWRVLTVVHNG